MLMENLKSEELLVNEEVVDLPDVECRSPPSPEQTAFPVCSDNDHEDDDMKDKDEGDGGE